MSRCGAGPGRVNPLCVRLNLLPHYPPPNALHDRLSIASELKMFLPRNSRRDLCARLRIAAFQLQHGVHRAHTAPYRQAGLEGEKDPTAAASLVVTFTPVVVSGGPGFSLACGVPSHLIHRLRVRVGDVPVLAIPLVHFPLSSASSLLVRRIIHLISVKGAYRHAHTVA
ncbi:hypothetical protein B0H19DRAFT_1253895 [Mycena capillaripes]|nr:hypothetical protein B0H19DRAFT_1253895 [Mycena capillaripes]